MTLLNVLYFFNILTGMCVLAGCDFLPSIPGIGIKRAYSFVSKYKNLDRVSPFVLSVLRLDKRYKMPEDYSDFFYHIGLSMHSVTSRYDMATRELKHLKPLEEKHLEFLNGDLDLLGPLFDVSTVARETALDQKYIKEAFALGRLVAPAECHQVMELEVDKASVPDNNPFKKRKLEKISSQKDDRRAAQAVVTQDENSVGMVCSSPQSQESVESKPKKSTPIEKEKTRSRRPKMKNENKSAGIEKNGILKFFQPL
ncbi:hypothetical protein B296_00017345 [Ensete ventricosum]|uniref:Exonuclease 1 n=1 Tax=Ensete ventricosum TaxID=4639 RepID=A0A426ZNT4_ENSVE|nr:hypothetical protein B296_00017345 [Ensete ventricosum]